MIALKLKHGNFTTEENCRHFARLISCIVQGVTSSGIPYQPNFPDWRHWVIDDGNNYRMKFYFYYPDIFSINYRYQCKENPYEEALAGWLKARFDADIININA